MHASREPRAGLASPAAGVPADHGVASLGLVMQLVGRTTGAIGVLAATLALLTVPPPGASWLWLAIALSIVRSRLHHVAGHQLTDGRASLDGPEDPFAATRRYAGFAIGQAIALAVIAERAWHLPGRLAAAIAAALALWPVVLVVVCRLPRLAALRGGIPLGEDRGVEAAGILMMVLGCWGALVAPAILAPLGSLSPHHLQHGWGVMLVVVFALLAVRSALHIRAGLAALHDASLDRPGELTARYAAFGVISAFCAGGVLALRAMSEQLTPGAIAGVAAVCWLLVAWPLIIQRYFRQRQFAELFAGARAPHRRACDGGLTGLGWLVAGHATAVAAALITAAAARGWAHRLDDLGPAAQAITRVLRALGPEATALGAGAASVVLVLEAATAIALIRMSAHRRAIATAYAVLAAIVAVVPAIPQLRALDLQAPWQALAILPAAIHLVLPMVTLALVRRVTLPAARAWYRRAPDIGPTSCLPPIAPPHVRDSPVPRIEA